MRVRADVRRGKEAAEPAHVSRTFVATPIGRDDVGNAHFHWSA